MLSSYEIFQSSIQSDHTLRIYKERLEQFHKFTRIKDYDSYLKMNPKDVQNLVMEYVIDLKKKIELGAFGPNAIPQRMSPIFLFMTQNDIIINVKKIKKMFPRRVKVKGELPYTRKDIQAMSDSTTNTRNKALVSFFASTGVRFSAVLDLRMKDLKEMDQGCMSVIIYRNDIEEYPVFLIPEAVNNLKKYFKSREFHGEKITEESPVFRNVYRKKLAWKNIESINENSLKQAMNHIIQLSQIRKTLKDSGDKHQKAMFGAFRKFFETTLNNINEINSNVVEKLMGHKNDLRGTYYNPELKVRFDNFKIAIPALTISDKNRDEILLEQKNLEINELKKAENRIEGLEDKIELIHKFYQNMVPVNQAQKK